MYKIWTQLSQKLEHVPRDLAKEFFLKGERYSNPKERDFVSIQNNSFLFDDDCKRR